MHESKARILAIEMFPGPCSTDQRDLEKKCAKDWIGTNSSTSNSSPTVNSLIVGVEVEIIGYDNVTCYASNFYTLRTSVNRDG